MPIQPQTLIAGDHARKCQLFIQALRSFGHASLRVTGTSMWPALWPGDTVEIRAARFEEVRTGDLVAFARDGRVFVHRVVRQCINADSWTLITRGDALPTEDQALNESELLGIARVTEKVPRTFLQRLRGTVHYRLIPPVLDRVLK